MRLEPGTAESAWRTGSLSGLWRSRLPPGLPYSPGGLLGWLARRSDNGTAPTLNRFQNRVKWRDFECGGRGLKLKKFLSNYGLLILVAGLVIILDQLSKAYVRAKFIEQVDMWAPWDWLLPYARIVYVSNTGVAFGLFKGMGGIFTILAIIVAIAIVYYFPRVPKEDWALRLAMGLQLGGAMGNLIDRVSKGFVTDFISVGNFPVFNFADAAITIGVGVLLLGVWLQERRQKKEADEQLRQAATSPVIESDPCSQDGQNG
jgi:signal peptidase II